MKKAIIMMVFFLILVVSEIIPNESNTINFDTIFKQEYILSKNWILDNSIGEKILESEAIRSNVQKSWVNKNDNSIIIVLGKESKGYYEPEYFQERDQINAIAEKYGLLKGFNKENLAFYNRYGVNMGSIDFTTMSKQNSCNPFCKGVWTTISSSLKLRNRYKYFNFFTVIFYRSFKTEKNAESHKEFLIWRDKLRLKSDNIKVIAPEITKYMRNLLKENQIIKKGEKPQSAVTIKPVAKENHTKHNNSDISEWFAPVDVLKVRRYKGKKVKKGSFSYDPNENSFRTLYDRKGIKVNPDSGTEVLTTNDHIYLKDVTGIKIGKKELLFRTAYYLKIYQKGKDKIKIIFSNLKKVGGYKFLYEYINKIRKINSILHKKDIDLL